MTKVGISQRGRAHPGSQRYTVVRALVEGPATSRQISERTGLEFYLCSALLSYLHRRKLVKRKRIRSGYRPFLYSL